MSRQLPLAPLVVIAGCTMALLVLILTGVHPGPVVVGVLVGVTLVAACAELIRHRGTSLPVAYRTGLLLSGSGALSIGVYIALKELEIGKVGQPTDIGGGFFVLFGIAALLAGSIILAVARE